MSTPWTYNATILRVVDGDTVDVDIDCGFDVHVKERLRLARINAPELSTPEGVASSQALSNLIAARKALGGVTVQTTRTPLGDRKDNWQRYIAELVLADGTNVSDWMLANNLAVPYPPTKGQ